MQFGGASGQGYLSHDQLRKAQRRPPEHGSSEKGKFYANDLLGPMDCFRALSEEAMGREMIFPKGRYSLVISMRPDASTYFQKGCSSDKTWRKTLGIFSERQTRADAVKVVDGGRWFIEAEEATRLYWVLGCNGLVYSQLLLKAESVGRLRAGESAIFSCRGQFFGKFTFYFTSMER